MKIIVDITHIPHINFLKNAINKLNTKGEDIKVICLNRGKNIAIAKEEFKGIEVIPLGIHKGTFLSIIFEANFLRFFKLFKYLLTNRFDIGVSVGSFVLGFVLKIFRKPNVQFYDDPENKKNLFFQKLTATELYYPTFYKNKKIKNFNALKEWAYLSPKYFKPNQNCLEEYGLNKKEYIFIREANSNTTNYTGQSSNIISTITDKFSSDMKIVLSLENKSTANLYPESWIILNEPVKDIHSLIYNSKILISSGDSMAREGTMLGVPSIYCGIRKMAANKILIDKGLLFHVNIESVPLFVDQIIKNKLKLFEQTSYREKLESEWDDVTDFIIRNIMKYKKSV